MLPIVEVQIDASSAAPQNLSSLLATIHRSGVGEGSVYSKPFKKHPCPQISEISQGRVEKITRGESPHSSFFFVHSTTSFPNKRRQHFSQSISS